MTSFSKYKLFLSSLLFLVIFQVNEATAEELLPINDPDVLGEWSETVWYDDYTISPGIAICRAIGGTWLGTNSGGCDYPSDDALENFNKLPAYDQAELVAPILEGLCDEPQIDFEGWNGYRDLRRYDNYGWGHLTRDSGRAIITGHTLDSDSLCTRLSQSTYTFVRYRTVQCPSGAISARNDNGVRYCGIYCEDGQVVIDGQCVSPPKTPPSCGVVGNPCQVSTGSKTQVETDFSNGLVFTRSYQTLNLVDAGLGKGWRSNFQKQISVSGDNLYVVEQSGRGDPWRKVNGVWENDIDSDYLLSETATGFSVTGKRGDVKEYDLDGRLLSETDTQNKVKSYGYDDEGHLVTVSNHYQQSLSFTYSVDGKNHIIKVVDAQGVEYRYEYDTNDNLIAVIYPDANTDLLDNPKRIYHYENTDFPNHLTGITDANDNRFGTYAYDANGKAISTEHAQTTNSIGQERFQLNYQGAN